MISAIVLTKNEEKNIVDCLESISFCDEIIIVDDFSDDRTLQLVERFFGDKKKHKIFKRKLDGDFSKQRNFAMDKASSDWLLFVDADERITPLLRKEIIYKLDEYKGKINGFYVKRENTIWGKTLRYGDFLGEKRVRLANRKFATWKNRVHEEWVVKGTTQTFKNPMLHFPHDSINEFLTKMNAYTDLRARELYNQGKRAGIFSVILYTKGKFIHNYILKLGFLDGIRGLIVALLMSLNSFLTRGKLWMLSR